MYRAKLLALGLLAVPFIAFACGDDPESLPATDVPEGGAPDVAQPDTATADSGPVDSLPRAGSRLVPQFVTTSDGLKVFASIFDKQLDTVCYPQESFDVVKRCAPITNFTANSVFYADAACTRPVIQVLAAPSAGCEASRFVQVQTGQPPTEQCAPKTATFTLHKVVAAKLDLPKVYAKAPVGGACSESGEPAGSFTELGAIPSSDLVKITDEVDPVSAAIGVHVSAGEDGSRFPEYDLRDVARKNAICIPGEVHGGKTNCLPSGEARLEGYVDNGCSQPAIVYNQCAKAGDPNASFVKKYATVNCKSTVTTYSVGAKRPTRDVFYGSPGNCSGGLQDYSDVFELGPVVAPSTFPELAYVEGGGGTRILAKRYESQGKLATHFQESFFDKTLDHECHVAYQADGKRYCVPTPFGTGGAIVYSDANCQTKIAAELTTDCAPPKFLREPINAPSLCNGAYPGIYQVGAQLQGTTAYQKTPQGACNPATNIKTLYALGAPMPASSFAEVTITK